MLVRVQFPWQRTRPAGSSGVAQPSADSQVEPGQAPDGHYQDRANHQKPALDRDTGTHVDKTA